MKQLPGPTNQPATNPEAEQAVLGAVLLRPEMMEQVADLLLPEDFYATVHADIYRALVALWEAGRPLDLVTLTDHLKRQGRLQEVGGPAFLASLPEHVGTSRNAGHYAQMVYDCAIKRRLWETCQGILCQCQEKRLDTAELLDSVEAQVFALTHTYLTGRIKDTRQILEEEKARLAELRARTGGGRRLSGVDTGFMDLNNLTYGWQPADMIVLGGRPGHGKTALGLNFAYAAAMAGQPAAFFSEEMAEGQLAQRLLSLVGGVSGDALRSGDLSAEDWVAIEQAAQTIHGLPLWILEGHHTILEVKSLCRRLKAQAGGLGLVVIDYLQMLKPTRAGRSRYEEISAISRAVKAMAKELKIPVVVNAQLNRKLEERKDRRPIMSDLRDSGEIEQDADCILFVYRDELYDDKSPDRGLVEVLVRKQRAGRTGSFKLHFRADLSYFDGFEKEEPPF